MRRRNWKFIFVGLVWVAGAVWLWCQFGQPIHHELALIRHAQVAEGAITSTVGYVGKNDTEIAIRAHSAEYVFATPDGRKFSDMTAAASGRLGKNFRNLPTPYPVQIEYLPDNPGISRIKGLGHSTVWQWLVFRVVLGGGLLALIVAPGVATVMHGWAVEVDEQKS